MVMLISPTELVLHGIAERETFSTRQQKNDFYVFKDHCHRDHEYPSALLVVVGQSGEASQRCS
ncbi:uncharacterized protein PHALS_14892 [Plasmopara halstedii]|uniref:Uncharacterized protein n=1 Tax=Plasmopara halstedii TaxID=4781 RepID=A0A0P1AVG9_PLAHL|nr:uncharacterized protein PHALS_14892 [Plasmopara halstedii]CEG46324.1 hypothetical protein PHALS_14892 [Plasmopara halstedii]|eukprot:XP_024582693.1 hypothetical protein PHALS_14892 [Plasmopara halstedii]